MSNIQEPILIGIKEATGIIGVGRNYLLDMVKIKGFPCIRNGNKNSKIWIIKNELEPWFIKHKGIYIK